MIEKIIASGKPGAAAAALEVAIKLGLAYGGWCREGETVEDKFRLDRLPGASNRSVTEKAVRPVTAPFISLPAKRPPFDWKRPKKSLCT